jgi:hypothetical protein
MADIFERIVAGFQVEGAAISTIKAWMETYLRELELQIGWPAGKIPNPAWYTTRNEFDSFPTDRMPMCVVVSPGLAEQPTKEGDGKYSAWWGLGIGFAAAARDADSSHILATIYGAAARAIMLHHSSLGGFANGVEWIDESYDDLVNEEERTIRACYNIYRVLVWDVTTKGVGPAAPTAPNPATQPGSDWPTADIIGIAINIV